MIRLFSATDKVFASNGDLVLKPIKANVHKADNRDYYLNLETDLEYIDNIVEGNIVVVNTPTGDQAFRIGNVQKTKNKISSKCYHVFYDSKNYLVANADVVNLDCGDALALINGNTEPQTIFSVSSDIEDNNSLSIIRKSLYGAITDVLSAYGGHLVRDNFSISIKESIGTDNGIVIRYKKNLKDITCKEDWSNVITKILPVGKEGLLLNALNPSADIYVTSGTQYNIPYTKTVSFSQDLKREDYNTDTEYTQALIDDLRAKANTYLTANSIPKVNYTLKANLEHLADIGDTVEVIDERLGVDLMASVISFDYDCISEAYTEVVFGNFTQSLSGFIDTVNAQTEKTVNATINNTFADSIRAYGVADGWTWRKYTSGIVECWKKKTVDSTSLTWSTLITGLNDATFSDAFPFSIADAVINANIDECDDTGWIANIENDTTTCSITVVRESNTGDMVVNICVKGRETS